MAAKSIMKIQLLLVVVCLSCGTLARIARAEDEVVIAFQDAEIGKPVPSFSAKGVTFEPGGALRRSAAKPRIMFFPHLMTDKKGILNAMANEAIPVQIRFPEGASKVTLVLFGSITSSALVEALDKDGKVVDKAARDKVPTRDSPARPIPSFELSVEAAQISSVRFSGAYPGGFLAAEEVRYVPIRNIEAK
jgi:hypothetical protein